MTDKNKITVPISKKEFLVYRVNELGASVLFVRRNKAAPDTTERLLDLEDVEQIILASTPVGCVAVANALDEMADKIRQLKKGV